MKISNILRVRKIYLAIMILVLLSLACGSSTSGDSSSVQSSSSNNLDTYAKSGPPVTIDGTGKTATSDLPLPSPYSKVSFQHNGGSNFIVTVFYGNEKDLLVNEIGPYRGTTLIVTDEDVMFDIDTDGSWIGKIVGVGKTSSASFSGTGDNVSGFFNPPSQGAWEISHNGESNFIVNSHCVGGSDLIINEIGALSGSTVIGFGKGPCLWEVKADGSWSLNPR